MNAPRLGAVLDEIEAFLEEQEDTRDGSDGKPLPNEAMRLLMDLRAARENIDAVLRK